VAALGVTIGDSHPGDPQLSVKDDGLEAERVSPSLFRVTATYAKGTFSGNPDPTLDPPDYQWVTGSATEPVYYDVDGNLILNSAGDLPTNQPTRLNRRLSLILGRNERIFPIQRWNSYFDRINSDSFIVAGFVIQPGQSCLKNIVQPKREQYTAKFVRVEYHIDFHPGYQKDSKTGLWDGFTCRFPDKGRMGWFRDDSGATVRDYLYLKGASGAPTLVTQDVPFDGGGRPFYYNRYTNKSGAKQPVPNPDAPKGGTFTVAGDGGVIGSYKDRFTAVFSALNIFY
jgi:hypothetical protein